MSDLEEKIAKWLNTNTFHHSEFWDLKELVRAKEKAGVSISLCIPTLNEENTIGKEIIVFKSELMDRYPLLDEIAASPTLATVSSSHTSTFAHSRSAIACTLTATQVSVIQSLMAQENETCSCECASYLLRESMSSCSDTLALVQQTT